MAQKNLKLLFRRSDDSLDLSIEHRKDDIHSARKVKQNFVRWYIIDITDDDMPSVIEEVYMEKLGSY